MGFFERAANGWTITKTSFKVLKANSNLVIFPILSGISLLLIFSSFFIPALAGAGWEFDELNETFSGASPIAIYGVTFLYYLINYFIIVFFNMALVHCTRLYFEGEEPTIAKGIKFSLSRFWVILSWAMFAATVGTILKAIQENAGWLGKIITGMIGIVWGIATFFAVPILAYEKLGPVDALKRSGSMMKERWGESIVATFSMNIIQTFTIFAIILVAFGVGSITDPTVGVVLGGLAVLCVFAIFSALNTIFVSAVYHNINGDLEVHFNKQMMKSLFAER